MAATDNNRKSGFHASELPESLGRMVSEFDEDGDGWIDDHEFGAALQNLKSSRTKNKALCRVIIGLSTAILVLIGSVFGVSIAAAYLAKDTKVDDNGVMQTNQLGPTNR